MPRTPRPCIIGVAQHTWRATAGDAPDPLHQAAAMAQLAAADCGRLDVLRHVDELDVVLPISWAYEDLCEQLARLLALQPGERRLSGLSGTSPQRFVNDAAEAIVRRERSAALICGAEAFATLKRARKEQRQLRWRQVPRGREFALPDPPIATETAHAQGILQAYTTFALLDSARRAQLRIPLDEYRKQQAQMMAKLSATAAMQPQAWLQKEWSAQELFEITADNRMVAYPYSKNMMAIMEVDMAAAVLVVSDELADELGVSQAKRVYLHGWDYAREPPYIAQRESLWHCPSMRLAAQNALNMARTTLDDVKHLELYSCFPSSLRFTQDALQLQSDDPRPLSVTGGLPYFGGPGNNYTTHALATLVGKLRQQSGELGLISGIGMHMTDHVFAVYSSKPPLQDLRPVEVHAREQSVREIDDEVSGRVSIVGYTILHEQAGRVAFAVCEQENGRRCYARSTDETTTQAMEVEEWVGKAVVLQCQEINGYRVNVF